MICTVLLSNKKYRSPCSFKKKNIYFAIELSLRGNVFRCVCAQAHLRPNDAKNLRSRDAQCNTEQSS